ncbi:MAG: HEAT repeat domain-containing protein, partial [Candidatus Omnitrophota bacterium]|nr:HEAT repeat domain-containing protein [Candidatus Omnitrophota bacterium]
GRHTSEKSSASALYFNERIFTPGDILCDLLSIRAPPARSGKSSAKSSSSALEAWLCPALILEIAQRSGDYKHFVFGAMLGLCAAGLSVYLGLIFRKTSNRKQFFAGLIGGIYALLSSQSALPAGSILSRIAGFIVFYIFSYKLLSLKSNPAYRRRNPGEPAAKQNPKGEDYNEPEGKASSSVLARQVDQAVCYPDSFKIDSNRASPLEGERESSLSLLRRRIAAVFLGVFFTVILLFLPFQKSFAKISAVVPLSEERGNSKDINVDEGIKKLKAENVSGRYSAIKELGNSGDSRAVKPLLNILKDRSCNIFDQEFITQTLIAMARSTKDSRVLIEILWSDNVIVRQAAKEAFLSMVDLNQDTQSMCKMFSEADDAWGHALINFKKWQRIDFKEIKSALRKKLEKSPWNKELTSSQEFSLWVDKYEWYIIFGFLFYVLTNICFAIFLGFGESISSKIKEQKQKRQAKKFVFTYIKNPEVIERVLNNHEEVILENSEMSALRIPALKRDYVKNIFYEQLEKMFVRDVVGQNDEAFETFLKENLYKVYLVFAAFDEPKRVILIKQLYYYYLALEENSGETYRFFGFYLIFRLLFSNDLQFIPKNTQTLEQLIAVLTAQKKVSGCGFSIRFGRNMLVPLNDRQLRVSKLFASPRDAQGDYQGLLKIAEVSPFIRNVRCHAISGNAVMVEYDAPWDILVMPSQELIFLRGKEEAVEYLSQSLRISLQQFYALYKKGYIQTEISLLTHHNEMTEVYYKDFNVLWVEATLEELEEELRRLHIAVGNGPYLVMGRQIRYVQEFISRHTNVRGLMGIVDGEGVKVKSAGKDFDNLDSLRYKRAMMEIVLTYIVAGIKNNLSVEGMYRVFDGIKYRYNSDLFGEVKTLFSNKEPIMILRRALEKRDVLDVGDYIELMKFIEQELPYFPIDIVGSQQSKPDEKSPGKKILLVSSIENPQGAIYIPDTNTNMPGISIVPLGQNDIKSSQIFISKKDFKINSSPLFQEENAVVTVSCSFGACVTTKSEQNGLTASSSQGKGLPIKRNKIDSREPSGSILRGRHTSEKSSASALYFNERIFTPGDILCDLLSIRAPPARSGKSS